MDPVRAAVIGVGWWAKTLAEAARGTGLGITACTARSPESRAAFAKAVGCRELPSFEAVLADRDVEAVVITTPHSLHAAQVLAAAEAGKHVFVEKPFTLTVADARRATEACRKAGVVLAVGHQRRRQAAARAMKRLIDDGALGTVVQVEGLMSADFGFQFKPGMWRATASETPGGAMTNMGIHHVDTFRYFLGPVARVSAFSRRIVLTGVDVEDTTNVLLEFASGALGYLGTCWVHANRLVYYTVHGTAGHAWSVADGERLLLARRGEKEPSPIALTPINAEVEELAEFARCVREGTAPEVGGAEATANIAVLEAVVESIATGRAVDVPR